MVKKTIVWLASLLATGLLARTSAAVTVLRHAPNHFEMTVRAEGAEVCETLPEGHEEAGACAGLDVAAMRRSIAASGQPMVAAALIRYDMWSVPVTVAVQRGEIPLATPADREAFAKGMRLGILGKAPGARIHGDASPDGFTTVTIDGRPAVKTMVEMDVSPGGPTRLLTYVVPTDEAIVLVTFTSDPGHVAELSRLAEASVATLRVQPPTHQKSDAYRLGFAIGLALPLVAGAVVALVLVMRGRRRA
jgi:hypothetical protein